MYKEKPLFEIPDYVYISGVATLIPLCLAIFLIGLLQTFGITHFEQSFMTRSSLLVTSGGGLTIILLMKIKSKKRRIQFFADKIVYTYNNIAIDIKRIEDIVFVSHFISSINFGGANPKKRKSWVEKNIFKRYLIGTYIFFVSFPIFFIPSIIVNLIMHKKLLITSCIIPLNWNDEKAISIMYPLPKKEENEKVKEYFRKYLNTNVNQIKKIYV